MKIIINPSKIIKVFFLSSLLVFITTNVLTTFVVVPNYNGQWSEDKLTRVELVEKYRGENKNYFVMKDVSSDRTTIINPTDNWYASAVIGKEYSTPLSKNDFISGWVHFWIALSIFVTIICGIIALIAGIMWLVENWNKLDKNFEINIGPKKKDPISDLEKMMKDLDEESREELRKFTEKLAEELRNR